MYDEIVMLENGVYHGVVSVRDLLHTMTEFQATMARNANPLTAGRERGSARGPASNT